MPERGPFARRGQGPGQGGEARRAEQERAQRAPRGICREATTQPHASLTQREQEGEAEQGPPQEQLQGRPARAALEQVESIRDEGHDQDRAHVGRERDQEHEPGSGPGAAPQEPLPARERDVLLRERRGREEDRCAAQGQAGAPEERLQAAGQEDRLVGRRRVESQEHAHRPQAGGPGSEEPDPQGRDPVAGFALELIGREGHEQPDPEQEPQGREREGQGLVEGVGREQALGPSQPAQVVGHRAIQEGTEPEQGQGGEGQRHDQGEREESPSHRARGGVGQPRDRQPVGGDQERQQGQPAVGQRELSCADASIQEGQRDEGERPDQEGPPVDQGGPQLAAGDLARPEPSREQEVEPVVAPLLDDRDAAEGRKDRDHDQGLEGHEPAEGPPADLARV